ncbi:MAG: hypothetical protein NDJ89_04375 [Oligoflexia bacterium]|nr:hypothetical protein [Oligoflexia bacterium]
MGVLLFSLSLFFLLLGVRSLTEGQRVLQVFFSGRERAQLRQVVAALQDLEETLEAGLLPAPARWDALQSLSAPWAQLTSESLGQLRSAGGALLPTLRRVRALASAHAVAWDEGRAKSAQALGQAFACALLAPLFGLILYLLLPGVSERPWMWGFACLAALGLTCAGSLWLHALAEAARWGGLAAMERPWMLAAQCAGERFLALLRSGHPPDLAWNTMLAGLAPELASSWGASIYAPSPAKPASPGGAKSAIVNAGFAIRKAIQVSLMEGRPCAERVESALESLRQELRLSVDRELALLGNRALKPLFLCVAPALLGLLSAGMALAWTAAMGA